MALGMYSGLQPTETTMAKTKSIVLNFLLIFNGKKVVTTATILFNGKKIVATLRIVKYLVDGLPFISFLLKSFPFLYAEVVYAHFYLIVNELGFKYIRESALFTQIS